MIKRFGMCRKHVSNYILSQYWCFLQNSIDITDGPVLPRSSPGSPPVFSNIFKSCELPLPFPPGSPPVLPRFFYLQYFGKEKCIVDCINFRRYVEIHHEEYLCAEITCIQLSKRKTATLF